MSLFFAIVFILVCAFFPQIVEKAVPLFTRSKWIDEQGRYVNYQSRFMHPKSARKVKGWRVDPAMYPEAFTADELKRYKSGEYIGEGVWYDPQMKWKGIPDSEERFLNKLRKDRAWVFLD